MRQLPLPASANLFFAQLMVLARLRVDLALSRQTSSLQSYRTLPGPAACPQVSFLAPARTVEEVGVEGLTFKFKWEPYAGHHCVSTWGRDGVGWGGGRGAGPLY